MAGNDLKVWVSLNLSLQLFKLHFAFLQERLIYRVVLK